MATKLRHPKRLGDFNTVVLDEWCFGSDVIRRPLVAPFRSPLEAKIEASENERSILLTSEISTTESNYLSSSGQSAQSSPKLRAPSNDRAQGPKTFPTRPNTIESGAPVTSSKLNDLKRLKMPTKVNKRQVALSSPQGYDQSTETLTLGIWQIEGVTYDLHDSRVPPNQRPNAPWHRNNHRQRQLG